MFFLIGLFSQKFSKHSISVNNNFYPRTNPDFIQVLFDFPEHYTVIGLVEVSKKVNWTKKKAKKKALKKVKKQAAKIGANAIVLSGFSLNERFLIKNKMNLDATAIFINHQFVNISNNVPADNVHTENIQSSLQNYQQSVSTIKQHEYNVGDMVIFSDEGRECVGKIIVINYKKKKIVAEFYHERRGKLMKISKEFDQLKMYKSK